MLNFITMWFKMMGLLLLAPFIIVGLTIYGIGIYLGWWFVLAVFIAIILLVIQSDWFLGKPIKSKYHFTWTKWLWRVLIVLIVIFVFLQ